MPIEIRPLAPVDTRSLRAAILRPNQRVEGPLHDDDHPAMMALGAFVTAPGSEPDALVGCCLLLPEPAPPQLGAPVGAGWRLRGMAVLPERRGGTGTLLLSAAISEVAARAGGVLWCHARVAARRLYERAGLVAAGDAFSEVGLPHVLMWRLVPAALREEAGAP